MFIVAFSPCLYHLKVFRSKMIIANQGSQYDVISYSQSDIDIMMSQSKVKESVGHIALTLNRLLDNARKQIKFGYIM